MIALGCDHGGLNLKTAIIKYLEENNIEYKDFGCYTEDSVDYPTIAYPVATAVANGEFESGILCCGTGIGISIAANKVKGIRAAVVSNEFGETKLILTVDLPTFSALFKFPLTS